MTRIDDVWVRKKLRWYRDMRAGKVDFAEFDQIARWGLDQHDELQRLLATLEPPQPPA